MTFVPDLSVLLAFTAAAAVLILTPGPDMMFYMSRTLSRGRKAGTVAVLGASTGITVHAILAQFGVAALLAASETAYTILKVIGAGYLFWLAVQSIRRGSSFSMEASAPSAQPLRRVWLQGLGINLLNPKIALFFMTFLPQFVSASDPAATGKLLFLALYFIVLGFSGCMVIMLGASAVSRFLKRSPRAMRIFDWTLASLMGTFAVRLLASRAAAG
ncbi:LysE family translocator [Roseibium sp.]|uniref:LysE family translocator n=1 Tax=Roseibium sp. TaxID=1936156 RepID=UPI003A96E40D